MCQELGYMIFPISFLFNPLNSIYFDIDAMSNLFCLSFIIVGLSLKLDWNESFSECWTKFNREASFVIIYLRI
jgi:hypothetical protein